MVNRREFLLAAGCGISSAGVASGVLSTSQPVFAGAELPALGKLIQPVPFSVLQRQGYDPMHASAHEPGGPKLGHAEVSLAGEFPEVNCDAWQFRTVPLQETFGTGTEWHRFEPKLQDGKLSALVRIPAGGWYRLEVRALRGEKTVATEAVEPVGVREVLAIAGKSYAAGANDELLKVDDPQGRVVAFDRVKNSWRVARDPQPNLGDGGTIWPPLGNLLLPLRRVPEMSPSEAPPRGSGSQESRCIKT